MRRTEESGRTGLVVLLSLAAAVLIALIVVVPLGVASLSDSPVEPDTARITSLDSHYTLAADGSLQVVERITTEMPAGKRGIFRYWDVTDPSDDSVRLIPRGIEVTRDGRGEPKDLSWEQGRRFRVARIGDEDTILRAGEHVYEIRYRIEGALSGTDVGQGDFDAEWPGTQEPARSAFFWNVVPQGWAMAIEETSTTIDLPSPSGQVKCAVGMGDAAEVPCEVTGAGTERLVVTTGALPPRTPVTLRADLPIEQPERASVPWSVTYDALLGRSPVTVAVILVLTALLMLTGIRLVLRSREAAPGFPVMYAPPDGLGPVQTYYVMHESVPANAMSATLIHLDELGLVTVREQPDDGWVIEGRNVEQHHWEAVDPVSAEVATVLGVRGPGTFHADGSVDSGEKLLEAKTALDAGVRRWAEQERLVATAASEQVGLVATVISMFLGGLLFAMGMALWFTLLALPFAAFALGSMGLLRTGVGTRRTPEGREVWSRAGGFRRMLATDSAEARFDFSAHHNLYTAYIPYAVAFGVADRWAEKYQSQMGRPAPQPDWYPVGYGAGMGLTGGGGGDPLAGFESSLASSISAYTATQSSSSSGGGSSGGGGGGGGGGGSW